MKDLFVKQALNTPLTYESRLLLYRKHGHSALLRRNAKGDYVVMSGHCCCPLLEQKSDEILFLAASRRDHVRGYCTTKLIYPPPRPPVPVPLIHSKEDILGWGHPARVYESIVFATSEESTGNVQSIVARNDGRRESLPILLKPRLYLWNNFLVCLNHI